MQFMRTDVFPRCGLLCLLAILVAAPVAFAQPTQENPLDMYMVREHPGSYQRGAPFTIEVTFAANMQGVVNAVGLRETLPPGWEFGGMRGVSGQPPAVSPQPGQQGLLEFAWITIPELPYKFAYDVVVPEATCGDKFIHGALEYRTDGGPLVGAPVITSIAGTPVNPPTVQLQGSNPMSISQGTPYTEPGYVATDAFGQDLTSSVQVSGNVNESAVGSYTLTYTVTDSCGNTSQPQQRVVQVVASSAQGGGGTGGGTSGGGSVGGGRGVNTRGGGFAGGGGRTYDNNAAERAEQMVAESQTRSAANPSDPRSRAATQDLRRGGSTPEDIRERLAAARAEAERNKLTLPQRMTVDPADAEAGDSNTPGGGDGRQPRTMRGSEGAGGTAASGGDDDGGLLDVWPEEEERRQLAAVQEPNLDGGASGGSNDQGGVWASLQQNVSDMGASGLLVVALFGVVGLGLAGAALYAGRMAYKGGSRRRRPGNPGS
jgi:hypothetical protein